MTKYVLLKSIVPSTYDAGFKASGYEVVELVETEEPVELEPGVLEKILSGVKKKVLTPSIISGARKK